MQQSDWSIGHCKNLAAQWNKYGYTRDTQLSADAIVGPCPTRGISDMFVGVYLLVCVQEVVTLYSISCIHDLEHDQNKSKYFDHVQGDCIHDQGCKTAVVMWSSTFDSN